MWLASILIALAARPGVCVGQPILNVPGRSDATPLRLEVLIDGRSPLEDWNAFLDRLFDHFDRDGNGSLSASEVRRMFPLPTGLQKRHVIDFKAIDGDSDGRIDRQEFRSYCVRSGFGPMVVSAEGSSSNDLRQGAWWQRFVKEVRAEKRPFDPVQVARYVRTFDLNEDEFLDHEEIQVAAASLSPRPVKDALSVVDAMTASVVRVDLGPKAVKPVAVSSNKLRLIAPVGHRHRLQGDSNWVLVMQATRTSPDLRSTSEFLIAQFGNALGARRALTKKESDADGNLSAILELFAFADRNDDGQLTLAELRTYLDLIGQGVRAQIHVQLVDRGHNPFSSFDENDDRRLSLKELGQIKLLP